MNNDINRLREYSQRCRDALAGIASSLRPAGCEVIFCEGDSLLAVSSDLVDLSGILPTNGELTFSAGIGCKPELALLALKKAKGLGKKQVATLPEQMV